MDIMNSSYMSQDLTTPWQDSTHPVLWIMFLVCYAIVLLTTIGGNIIVIASYVLNDFVRNTVANIFILNLSISDVLVGSIVMVVDFLTLAIGSWPFGDIFCAVWLSMHYFVIYMSVVTVIVISIDRLWLISDVLRYKRLQNHTIARGVVILVWIYTTLFTILYSVSTNDIMSPSTRRGGSATCLVTIQNTGNMLLSIILENLDFIIPLVLLVAVNVTVAFKVHRKLNNRNLRNSHPKRTISQETDADLKSAISTGTTGMAEHSSQGDHGGFAIINDGFETNNRLEGNENQHAEHDTDSGVKYVTYETRQCTGSEDSRVCYRKRVRKRKENTKLVDHTNVARSVFLLTTVYTACWLPYHILVLLQTWHIYQAPRLIWEILQRLIWFNSMVNPFLYAKMNMRFRLGMLKVLFFRRSFQDRVNRLQKAF
ncbi:histamine H4 receptor-like [Apostichopus japonicus]|uniref:histamine H4 receptor-like n=1 Tax=Stichopus japonicus TaxID=307972 RepID=UPI003AB141ED